MKIIVSMTTIPSRIGRIRPMVDSVLGQSRKPDSFVLWLPERCEKEGCGYGVPDWMGRLGLPTVAVADRDWGPATKLIPAVRSVLEHDVLIVTLDDDVAYHPGLLGELEAAAGAFPDSALGLVGVRGRQYVHAEQVNSAGLKGVAVDVLGGYRGAAYRRSLFDGSLESDAEALLAGGPFVLDDHLISWNLARRSKDRVVIRSKSGGGGLNFRFLNLGNGIYDEGKNRAAVDDSMRRIRELYKENGWQHPA